MLKVVNRLLLGLVGVVLLGSGLAVLAGALNLPSRWGVSVPSWAWSGPDDVLLTEADRTEWRDEGWWWPVVLTTLAVVLLLILWWLLAQFRRQRLAQVLVDSGDGAGALVRGSALEEVLIAEAASLPGIDRARVRLWGRRRTQPKVWVGLVLDPHAEPAEAVRRLRTQALENARKSAGLKALPAEVRLRSARHRAERVS